MGFWINADGLPLQFGTDKAVNDLGGDYLAYGEQRVHEVLISLSALQLASGALQNPALPSSFVGTNPSTAGIVSLTTLFPLQQTAPVTASNSSGVLQLPNPQLRIEQIDVDTLIAAANGGGSGTGLTGVGLAVASPVTQLFVQVTPNAGVQLLGACANARMALGSHYSFYADQSAFGTGTPPTAGSWLGNVPKVTNTFTGFNVPAGAYVSAIASGGQFTQSGAGGLIKLRTRYTWYGNIAN